MTEQSTPAILFTDAAALKVKMLIDEEGNPLLNLRAYITGGGCSGFQYGFTFDEQINEDDIVIVKQVAKLTAAQKTNVTSAVVNENEADDDDDDDGKQDEDEGGEGGGTVKLLIDPISFQYLQNAEIDYREDVKGEQFVIRNPNAKTTCGCGSSFAA